MGAQGQHLKQATGVRTGLWESRGLGIFRRGSCHLCGREVRLPDQAAADTALWGGRAGGLHLGLREGRTLGPSISPLSLTSSFHMKSTHSPSR